MTESSDVHFGPFRLNLTDRKLWFDGAEVRLGTRAAEILRVLALAEGEVVTKDDLMAAVWPGQIVEENVVQVHVSNLRKAIAQHGEEFSFIVTAPGRGYRFVASLPKQAIDSSPEISDSDKPSIAVLPFGNMSGDPEQEYFADGITNDIITTLARSRWFYVIARNSAFTYKGKAVDARIIGRELGARYLLEGSVRRSGARLRITGQLIEAENGRHVWADKYDGEVADIFELQDRVTAAVAAAIEPRLRATEIERSRRKPTSSLAAYDHVLRAIPMIGFSISRDSLTSAIEQLRRAIELDPAYAHAKALLAYTLTHRVAQTWETPEDIAEGVDCAQRAIASGVNDPETLALAGLALALLTRRYDEALEIVERAYAIAPNLFSVASASAWINFLVADFETALARFRLAHRLSPIDPIGGISYSGLSLSLFMLGRAEEGAAAARRAIAMSPNHASTHRALIVNLVELGRIDEAREQLKELLRITPHHTTRSLRRVFVPAMWERYIGNLRKAGLPD